jgi:2',3'-cyclic-nucleotide 2'-phosphodiesterase (5'-nucleotidase family)
LSPRTENPSLYDVPSLLTRRRFLHLLGQGALVAAWPAPLRAVDPGTVTISLLHTTDLHGHILPTVDYHARPNLGGLARCASQIRAWRAANPNSLLLDVGDVYQGTAVSLASRGALMIRCFGALGYDAWVVGNHEFDWGADAFTAAVAASPMPVLSGNARLSGPALERIRPWLMKEIAGIRLAIVGLTTPALTTWLPPENLRDYEALDPVESLRRILVDVAAQKPDAIVLAGHMGLKRRDDFANRVGELTRDFPQLAVCLGGHTHEDWPGDYIHGVLYTQADHYGIHAGKVDLTFDRATHRLVGRAATTVLMDSQVPFDPQVMALAQPDLAATDRDLAREIGVLTEPFRASIVFGRPGEQERLIASGMLAALRKRSANADVIIHGLFEKRVLEPGAKTVADMWRLLPYENQVVSFDVSGADLPALAQEIAGASDLRQIMGLRVEAVSAGKEWRVTDLRQADGTPLSSQKSYRIAVNSHDSQSAGGRLPVLAGLVAAPNARRVLHPVETRDALIDFFTTRGKVGAADLLFAAAPENFPAAPSSLAPAPVTGQGRDD